ncbi:Aste57867_2433 [Aphanomyces stellatus]|uniref:Aste57867_2433 protein n=1 Tax=Aphanomyces stellatus TaxID=120398 RepID=A0A485K8A3_9STRA|nr:hypothetical protein As57867_002427 [Aphanomyces stellatus]VFT79634.1 Aste57867_2433 [Aphanomyces stellatus]
MTSVAPLFTDVPTLPMTRCRHDSSHRVLGLVFVVTSGVMTGVYMESLISHVQNDYFWTHFNASGAQTFVSDVFNTQLWLVSMPATLPLFDVASEKDYSQPQSLILAQATDARRIAMETFRHIPAAIAGLRSQSAAQTTRSMTHYCWLDFNHAWEVAHTTARQARCRAMYAANGVVYMESMLRNTDWTAWHAMWGTQFQVAFGSAVDESAGGPAWLHQTTTALAASTIDMEVAYWIANNITDFVLPWHNRHAGGFDNAMLVRNALQSYSIPLHHVQYARRSSGWTSVIASMGIYNDFGYTSEVGVSLVRNATNSFTTLDPAGPTMDTGTVWGHLLSQTLSPVFAMDLVYVAPPLSAVTAYTMLLSMWQHDVQSNPEVARLYRDTPSTTTFDMTPPRWATINTDTMFYGGNPLCYNGVPQAHVLAPFGFDDACAEPQARFSITPTTTTVVLALSLHTLAASVADVCALNRLYANTCQDQLPALVSLWRKWSHDPPLQTLWADVVALNISFMQYAMVSNMATTLHQPLLDEFDPSWSFYGWLHLVEWLQGTREVVSFQGDVATWVLMSKAYSPDTSFQADAKATPSRVSHMLWLLLCYTCGVWAVVLVVALVYAGRGFSGRNLYFFSPVVGVVWIGRPLLMVRGATAMTMLSSATMELVAVDGWTRLVVVPRPYLQALVVSGETLWLTFAVLDVISVATKQHTRVVTMASCGLIWLVTLVFEVAAPFQPSATVDRVCTSYNLDAQVSCVSGVVTVGSPTRLVVLCCIQATSIVVSYMWARCALATRRESDAPVLVPAVANHLLVPSQDGLYFDPVGSVLSGCIPLTCQYLFSIQLWVFIPMTTKVVCEPALRLESTTVLTHRETQRESPHVVETRHAAQKLRAVVAVVFLIGSATSSALFLYVLQNQLSNDFLWSGFNSTGLQPFLIDWYNAELKYEPPNGLLEMTALPKWYNGTTAGSISTSGFYAKAMQFERLSLLGTIQGLRRSDPCALPWIATQYCWVDFTRTWDMAYTATRQERCQRMATNGAVYLDAMLRNTDINAFRACWGAALDAGIFQDLQETLQGRNWIASIPSRLSVEGEVTFWHSHAIDTFVVAWQNFKSIGVVETFSIQTAMGTSYPITLKSTTGAYAMALQTSMKMYWGWGSDLWAQRNDTVASLIRTSAHFAYANRSMESLVLQNQSMAQPLDSGLALFRAVVGPFGSIDLVHVPCPFALLELIHAFHETTTSIATHNMDAQRALTGTSQLMSPIPWLWKNKYAIARGGNVFCPLNSAKNALPTNGYFTWFSALGSCSNILVEAITVSQDTSTIALIASGAYEVCNNDVQCTAVLVEACAMTTFQVDDCVGLFRPVVQWTLAFVPSHHVLFTQSALVRETLVHLAIEMVQYAQHNASSPVELLRSTLFTDPAFDLFAWMLMVEWADSLREVVSFQGDVGSFQTLSSYFAPVVSTPNALEIPHNAAYYWQLCLDYTTGMTFIVTFFTLVYAVSVQGQIEGLNMLEIHRVGGIVWVGRPLLFLRSAVAILVLATSQVTLAISGTFTTIQTPTPLGLQSLTTVLAGSETCWLVIVLTDLGLVVSQDHSNRYSLRSSILATLVSVLLTVASPVQPSFQLARACDATEIDLQLTCHAGVVTIGSSWRVMQLVVITSASVVICFAWDKWWHPSFRLPRHKLSLLLPAGGHFLFHKKPWIFNRTLYLDKASAFMCGLLTLSTHRGIHILDIKTWRIHTISIDKDFDPRLLSSHEFDYNRITAAVPLVD